MSNTGKGMEERIKGLIYSHTCELILHSKCDGNGCMECDGEGVISGKDLVKENRRLALAEEINRIFKEELEKKEKLIKDFKEEQQEYMVRNGEQMYEIDELKKQIAKLQSENENLKIERDNIHKVCHNYYDEVVRRLQALKREQ